jgi:hypothetical protein
VLRTYTSVYVYDRPGHEVARAPLPSQPQGESVAADGDRLLVGSEGARSTVLAVPVPGDPSPATSTSSTAAASSPAPSPTASASRSAPGRGGASAVAWGVVGLVLLLGGLLVVLARRRQATGSIR